MVILHAPASGGGGITRYSRELAEALTGAGERVREVRIRPWRLRLGGREVGGFLSVRAQSWVRPLVKEDVLHSTFHYAAHPRCDVATVHDLFQETMAAELGVGAAEVARMRQALQRLARRRVQLVCDSEATRRAVLDHGVGVRDEDAHLVYPGIHERFSPGVPPAQGPHADREQAMVLCVADLNPRKRLDWLLEAAVRIDDPGLRICWVGSQHQQRPAWARLAQRVEALAASLGSRLEVLGQVPEARLIEMYRSARLVVLPSADEGFGYPPLEALACGTPVAVSDRPVFRETLGDEATRFAEVDGLVQAIRKAVASKPPTDQERQRRHEWVMQRYGWKLSAAAVRSIYAGIRAGAPRPKAAWAI